MWCGLVGLVVVCWMWLIIGLSGGLVCVLGSCWCLLLRFGCCCRVVLLLFVRMCRCWWGW